MNWEKFHKLRGSKKASFFKKKGKIFHIIESQQFNRELLDKICKLSNKTRKVAETKKGKKFLKSLLFDKRAMLYFSQPSSRTFLSFASACQILGMDIVEVRDPSISSEKKGETQEDSIRTFSSYTDLVIMRHYEKDLAEKTAWMMNSIGRPVPVINAGSGKDQHPTQALLDVYTLHRSFEKHGGIDGIKIAMVGDLKRGRTVRSLSYLLKHYKDVHIFFVSPSQLKMRKDIKDYLKEKNVSFSEKDKLEEVISEADAIYITRIQDEWDKDKESSQINYEDFKFKKEFVDKLKPNAIIMHPLPRREEIPKEIDNIKNAVYWRQVRNGMWARAALISTIFNKEEEILNY